MMCNNWDIFYPFKTQFLHLGKCLFKNKDENGRYLVYMWKHFNNISYIGNGTIYRPISHCNDTLSRHLDPSWELVIVAEDLTKEQAVVLEAKLIHMAAKIRRFSVRGSYEWDGVSLINKVIPRTYKKVKFEILFEKHLNLNDRNWAELEREISRY